ncbi:MAG: hypothetical protein Q9180_008527, partial [Flavoplaca navasiana]
WLALLSFGVEALRWSPEHVGYNLNENRDAIDPTDYWGEWQNHTYHPSPTNWRFPFYVATIDRFVDGDPTNNEANGTVFEHNWMTNQCRFGGDVKGLEGNLDYIQGLGIKASLRGIYLTGSRKRFPSLDHPNMNYSPTSQVLDALVDAVFDCLPDVKRL